LEFLRRIISMQFEFATANRIIYGKGKIKEIGKIVQKKSSRVFLVCGRNLDRYSSLNKSLSDHKISYYSFSVTGEPTLEDVRKGVELCRLRECDLVISIGGGSVIDAGKAIALLSANEGDILDYLEVVGRGKQVSSPGIPMIAVPTTAGTGSEVTRNAVIGVNESQLKVSLRSAYMLPWLALIDPELSITVPPKITASTGMDALTQLIEPYVSNQSNPITDAFCIEGLMYAAKSIRQVYNDGADLDSRGKMSIASLFSGFALANAKLGAVHGFAGVLGGMYGAPHGEICASLLPAVMEVNIQALQRKDRNSEYLKRFELIARILSGNEDCTADEVISFIQQLTYELNIPSLSNLGVLETDYPEIIIKAAGSSSMKGNPILLTPDEMYKILELSQ
jgi:alcohol dehydrogenase class IV